MRPIKSQLLAVFPPARVFRPAPPGGRDLRAARTPSLQRGEGDVPSVCQGRAGVREVDESGCWWSGSGPPSCWSRIIVWVWWEAGMHRRDSRRISKTWPGAHQPLATACFP